MKCVSPGMPAIAIVHHAQENLWAFEAYQWASLLAARGYEPASAVRDGLATGQARARHLPNARDAGATAHVLA